MRVLHLGAGLDIAPSPDKDAPRLFAFRAVRALVLGVVAMAAVAWIVTVPGVLAGAVCGAAAAVLASQVSRFTTLVFVTLGVAIAAAFAGSIALGHGSLTTRLLAGLVAGLAAGPWSVVLAFVIRARAFRGR